MGHPQYKYPYYSLLIEDLKKATELPDSQKQEITNAFPGSSITLESQIESLETVKDKTIFYVDKLAGFYSYLHKSISDNIFNPSTEDIQKNSRIIWNSALTAAQNPHLIETARGFPYFTHPAESSVIEIQKLIHTIQHDTNMALYGLIYEVTKGLWEASQELH